MNNVAVRIGHKARFEGLAIACIATALTFGLLEIGAKIILHYKAPPPAKTNKVHPDHMAIYKKMLPDLSEADIKGLFVPFRQTYEPWVGFRNEDLNYPLVNASGLVRRTIPEATATDGQTNDVWFFGGSTMFGVHAPDDRTLPSAFIKSATKARDLPFKATNYGQPYYYSKQEAVLFHSLLLDGKKPSVAVFLDGLNEFIQPGASFLRTPFWSPAFQWMFEQPQQRAHFRDATIGVLASIFGSTSTWKLIGTREKKIWEAVPPNIINQNYNLPTGIQARDGARKVAELYVGNVRKLGEICKTLNVLCVFFLQPIPFVNYDRSADSIAMKTDRPDIKEAYDIIKIGMAGFDYFVSLDDAFSTTKNLPYIDAFHYSPYGNQVLADRILEAVQARLAK